MDINERRKILEDTEKFKKNYGPLLEWNELGGYYQPIKPRDRSYAVYVNGCLYGMSLLS